MKKLHFCLLARLRYWARTQTRALWQAEGSCRLTFTIGHKLSNDTSFLDCSLKLLPFFKDQRSKMSSSIAPIMTNKKRFFPLLFASKGSSLISLVSLFRDCQNDRIWKFGCGYNQAVKEHCHWTPGYANDARKGINYNCPNNGFLAGKVDHACSKHKSVSAAIS